MNLTQIADINLKLLPSYDNFTCDIPLAAMQKKNPTWLCHELLHKDAGY